MEEWKPLPKREKRKNKLAEEEIESKFVLNQRIVVDNVEQRALKSHRNAQATLSSKDGCAGKNYECIQFSYFTFNFFQNLNRVPTYLCTQF